MWHTLLRYDQDRQPFTNPVIKKKERIVTAKQLYPKFALDRSSKIPLYQQLYDIVRGEILSGKWKPGDLLPAEPEFMDMYDVSRITVRQVFDMLSHEGMIQRQRGRGTFVTQPDIVGSSGYVYDFAYEMYQRNLEPTTRVLSTHLARVSQETAAQLQIEIGDEIACLEQLRLADNEPISIEESYLVHDYCPGILDAHNFAQESLRDVLQSEYNIHLVKARQVIRAIAATSKMAKLLQVQERFPVLFVERVTFTAEDVPVEYLRIYYRSDRFEIQSELPIFQGS